jgi:putative hydrolase of the HAD superfamily
VQSAVVVFDGDDTLWWTEPLYDMARSHARERVAQTGLDGAAWEALERTLDVRNVAQFGFGRERFPTSCVGAYEQLTWSTRRVVDPTVSDEIWAIADSVFAGPAPVVEGAVDVIETLAAIVPLALLTRGDPEVQELRIEHSGLAQWFKRIDIVREKSSERFASVLRGIQAAPSRSWSVGNSRRSDIDPALSIGMHAIWIDAHVWEYERAAGHETHERLHIARELREVPCLVLPRVAIDPGDPKARSL